MDGAADLIQQFIYTCRLRQWETKVSQLSLVYHGLESALKFKVVVIQF